MKCKKTSLSAFCHPAPRLRDLPSGELRLTIWNGLCQLELSFESHIEYSIIESYGEENFNFFTIGNKCVPIQLAQCRFPGQTFFSSKILIGLYIFRIKYAEAILSNSTRKLLLFEITKMLIAI